MPDSDTVSESNPLTVGGQRAGPYHAGGTHLHLEGLLRVAHRRIVDLTMAFRARVSPECFRLPDSRGERREHGRTRAMLMREEKLSTRLETSASAFCSSDFCFCTAAAAAAAVGPGAEPGPPPALLIAGDCRFDLCGLHVRARVGLYVS
jgi:hypothetical protein